MNVNVMSQMQPPTRIRFSGNENNEESGSPVAKRLTQLGVGGLGYYSGFELMSAPSTTLQTVGGVLTGIGAWLSLSSIVRLALGK